jgi:Domain of unknown function (DUF4397)
MATELSVSRRHNVAILATALLLALSVLAIPLAAREGAAQADPLATQAIILHQGVDTGELEVFINGNNVLDEFSYGEQSDWLDLEPGAAQLTFTADRAGFNYVVFDAVYPVPAGNMYYVVITDALVLVGTLDTASVAEGQARAQFLHASVDTPPVDVHVQGDGVDETVNIAYAGSTEAVEAAAGTYAVDLTLSDGGESVLSVPDLTLEAGMSYLVIAAGDPSSDDHPLELVTIVTEVEVGTATPAAATPAATPVA